MRTPPRLAPPRMPSSRQSRSSTASKRAPLRSAPRRSQPSKSTSRSRDDCQSEPCRSQPAMRTRSRRDPANAARSARQSSSSSSARSASASSTPVSRAPAMRTRRTRALRRSALARSQPRSSQSTRRAPRSCAPASTTRVEHARVDLEAGCHEALDHGIGQRRLVQAIAGERRRGLQPGRQIGWIGAHPASKALRWRMRSVAAGHHGAMEVVAADRGDAGALADIFVAARQAAMPWLPELHDPDGIAAYFATVVADAEVLRRPGRGRPRGIPRAARRHDRAPVRRPGGAARRDRDGADRGGEGAPAGWARAVGLPAQRRRPRLLRAARVHGGGAHRRGAQRGARARHAPRLERRAG